MAKKKKEDSITEIRKVLEAKKLVMGEKVTMKELQKGNIKKVFLAGNCKKEVKEEFLHYCKMLKIECIELKQTNEEIGNTCKKPFSISVLGAAK